MELINCRLILLLMVFELEATIIRLMLAIDIDVGRAMQQWKLKT